MFRSPSPLRRLLLLGCLPLLVMSTYAKSEGEIVQITVPTLESSISLPDGIETEAWRQAAKVFGFALLADPKKPASQETVVRFLSDHANLYVAFWCKVSPDSMPRRNGMANQEEPFVWREDSVELFLAKEGDTGQEYVQFILGASGAFFHRAGSSAKPWNPSWGRWVQVQEGNWLAMLQIPFAALGLPQAPEALRFAVARNIYTPKPEMSRLINTGSTDSYVGSVEEMGWLKFNPENPVASVTAREDFSLGEIVLFSDAVRLPPDKFADSILEVRNSEGQLVAEDSQQARFDSRTAIHRISNLPDGTYSLRYRMQRAKEARVAVYGADAGLANLADEEIMASATQWEWPIKVQSKLRISAEVTLPDRARRIAAEVTISGRVPSGSSPALNFTLNDQEGQMVQELGSRPFSQQFTFESPLPELQERTNYYLDVSIQGDEGILAECRTEVKIPPKPLWLGTKVGSSTEIPSPWGPVEKSERTVSVWGREYTFDRGPVPSQIVSQGRELLAAPARLVLEPAPVDWRLEKSELEGEPARAALFTWSSEGGDVPYRATTRIEFDGAIRIDVAVPADSEIRKMAFEMEVNKDLARYIHRGPLMWGSMKNSYQLPDHPENYPILTVFHFLDDRGGLTWFDLMNFDWKLANPERALEMIPRDEDAMLRVNYIDGPSNYPIERMFSFGLQALPARPMPETGSLLRWWTGVRYGDEDASISPAWLSEIEYSGKGNVSLQAGTAEMWVKPAASPTEDGTEGRFFSIEHGAFYKFQLLSEPIGGLTVRLIGDGGRSDFSTKVQLPTGVWSHIGLAWTSKSISVFLNGELLADFPAEVAKRFNVSAHRIYVGGDQISLDGIKITNEGQMPEFDLSGHFGPTENTLLCDNFEEVRWQNGRKATVPLVASEGTEGGYLSPDANWVDGKSGRALGPLTVPVKSVIQGMADCGLSTMMYHAAQYTDISCGGLYIADEVAFRKLNDAAKEVGLKVCMYLNNSLSNYDWMWQTYAKDWLIEPRNAPFIQAWIPNEHVYQASPRSEYFEFFIWRISELQKEYGIDGFFLDGRMYCASQNPKHEEILENFEGETITKRDMWDGRSRQMRVMQTIHENGGFYLQHKSGLWDAPAVFFNDGVWEGEQLMGTKQGNRALTDILPLDSFRAQISGINFGMPSAYAAPPYSPLSPIEMATYSFVHGTTPAPFYRLDEALVYRPFWKALDRFGATYQNFHGYWTDQPPAKVVPNPDHVKVSAHIRPGKSLLMVSNFDTKSVQGNLIPDLGALDLKNPDVTNALTGEVVPFEDGVLPIHTEAMRSTWFLLEENENTKKQNEKIN